MFKESQCDQIFNSTLILYLKLVEKQDQRKSGWLGNLTRPALEMLLHPRKEEFIPTRLKWSGYPIRIGLIPICILSASAHQQHHGISSISTSVSSTASAHQYHQQHQQHQQHQRLSSTSTSAASSASMHQQHQQHQRINSISTSAASAHQEQQRICSINA